jgi:hypothetical protein
MRARTYLLLAMALAFPASVFAAQPQPTPVASERRLSPDEVERVLAEAAARREAAEDARLHSGPQVSGEVGFGIGTGGYRSAYGTVGVPLDDGFASFSFSSERARNRYTTHRNH